ncbi:MAG: hypothetical protein QXQ91_04350 [Nanopusillaceae archaeon]
MTTGLRVTDDEQSEQRSRGGAVAVAVDGALVKDLLSAIWLIYDASARYALAYALSHVAPRARLRGDVIIVFHPETGRKLVHVERDSAVVYSAEASSGSVDALLRDLLNAAYTFITAYTEFVEENQLLSGNETVQRVFNRLVESAELLVRHGPVPAPTLHVKLRELLERLGPLLTAGYVYTVKAPPRLGDLWSHVKQLRHAIERTSGRKVLKLQVVPHGRPYLRLLVDEVHPIDWVSSAFSAGVLAEVTGFSCSMTECTGRVEVVARWENRPVLWNELIVRPPEEVERELELAAGWRRLVAQMLSEEEEVLSMLRRNTLIRLARTPGHVHPEKRRSIEEAIERLESTAKTLEFWRTLVNDGEWRLESSGYRLRREDRFNPYL